MKARLFAYYLPQYHPIPENDRWWGKGFTEWTNVTKARPLFHGHRQPKFPADLSYYDLRVPEVRSAQADLAKKHGIEGFCYYHYWFGDGNRLLERPFDEVLRSGEPTFPFSLCWANESWTGIWFGDGRTLIEQRYGGRTDLEKHFQYLSKAFADPRYITVDGKPLFQILTPSNLPNPLEVTETLRELAHRRGFRGLYLVAGYRAELGKDPRKMGFDAAVSSNFRIGLMTHRTPTLRWTANRLLASRYFDDNQFLQRFLKRYYRVVDYAEVVGNLTLAERYDWNYFPCAIPNWDNTPRSGLKGFVLTNSTPEKYQKHLEGYVDYVQLYEPEHRIVFLKSWNEWAEGNYLEPDSEFGSAYLEATRMCVV